MADGSSTDSIIKVLVVDDNPKNLVAMSSILSELPVEVHTVESGLEALKIVLRHDFAVIYLDVHMPEMDGYEVADYLSHHKATANVPIVFVTAIHNDMEQILKGYKVGAIDYLSKPVSSQVVQAKTKIFMRLYRQQKQLLKLCTELEELANNDTLTGLSNRYHFNLYMKNILASSQRHQHQFALLIIDLDNFKGINDSFGHDAGDDLLQQVASRLLETLRGTDQVSRLGGDEFAILLTELASLEDASRIAVKLLSALREPIFLGEHKVSITVSIGIAVYPVASNTAKGLYKAADIALYNAKEQGKNVFKNYTNELNESYSRRRKIESSFKDSVDNSDIILHYQPRVSIKTGEIIGVEALARWKHKELGDISPLEFILIAEQMGCISTLGHHLISKGFAQFKSWQDNKKLNFSLAINLSPYQLQSLTFIDNIRAAADSSGVDMSRIEFELTESIFKGEYKVLEKSLDAMCDMGCMISIDDFGTGYSSLARLKLLPIKILKIDQSFVKDITIDANDAAIVKAVIGIANALQLEVVAEGVETKEQADFLLKHGCDIAQGYYYSKPVSAEKINELLKQGFIKR